ncbi:Interferon-induced GTP-binding protein Mx, partial [Apiospora marii]
MAIDSNEGPSPGSALPAMDALQSARSKKRINQIDQVRSYGVGDIVSLPQLVVCGDQSTGKSSVLEGITGMPFPRKDGICTRFPTEIILRRSRTDKSIVASIQPHQSRPAETRGSLAEYRRSMVGMSELPQVTQEVSKLLGLRGDPSVVGGSAFASDVLRIEVTGHTDFNLTVVDLPGLISASTEEQSNADAGIIRALVEEYVRSSRTIILAVIQAGNDVANQSIVELARKHDPDGQRTVGIITKADLINKGTERRLADLAMNRGNVKLELGFFLLKNPTPTELDKGITAQQRLLQETNFFASPVWQAHNLDMSRVGVENLKLFLQDLLDRHIEKELPNVIEEIKHHLREAEASLALLGPERSTVSDIRFHVTKISMDYYHLVQAALTGDYYGFQREYFHKGTGSRLRAVIHNLNTAFAAKVLHDGEKRKVVSDDAPGSEDGNLDDLKSKGTKVEQFHIYTHTRGRELPGSYNYVLQAELFREQSSPWESLAHSHIRKVFTTTTQWVTDAAAKVVPETAIRREIISIYHRWLGSTEARADDELRKLLADEKRYPITYNHYYTDNIQKARRDALIEPVKEALLSTLQDGRHSIYRSTGEYTKSMEVVRSQVIVDMDEQACSEALICLNAYYKVAMKTFVDNICRQVVERHIRDRLPDVFNPSIVAQFSDEKILLLGSESEAQQRMRDGLTNYLWRV